MTNDVQYSMWLKPADVVCPVIKGKCIAYAGSVLRRGRGAFVTLNRSVHGRVATLGSGVT